LVVVNGIFEKHAPLFNEFTLISVNLDESKALESYNLDEIDINRNPKPHNLVETVGIGIYRQ
jgi:hypothetical protein